MKILLIEDDPDVSFEIPRLLNEASSEVVVVELAQSLAEARAILTADAAYDLVLLDLGLPDAVGLEALEWLRAENPTLPVVVMTGSDDPALVRSALRAGASDFMVKWVAGGDEIFRRLQISVRRAEALAALERVSEDASAAITTQLGVILANVRTTRAHLPEHSPLQEFLDQAERSVTHADETLRSER